MFSWFTEWNKRHPVDVYRPAILVGVVGTHPVVTVTLLALAKTERGFLFNFLRSGLT